MRGPNVPSSALEWGIASLTLPGESVSGDTAVIESTDATTLVGVIDGVGHGIEAASAAALAAGLLRERVEEPPSRLIEMAHQALGDTRGVAMSLASFQTADDLMTWCGLGNVEGRLVDRQRADHSIMLASGIVGHELPRLRSRTLRVRRGSILIMTTDGVRSLPSHSFNSFGTAQQIADAILARHGTRTDDCLVLVARYLGTPK
jgi:negative regulator of sigma-B (phosphoserine phosphatase)